jgi:hypothetical protein
MYYECERLKCMQYFVSKFKGMCPLLEKPGSAQKDTIALN